MRASLVLKLACLAAFLFAVALVQVVKSIDVERYRAVLASLSQQAVGQPLEIRRISIRMKLSTRNRMKVRTRSQREELDESQHKKPDAERRLMCVNNGLIDPVVVCDTDRVADSSLIWIVGVFMRLSVQRRTTKPSPFAMPFTNTSHLRTSLE